MSAVRVSFADAKICTSRLGELHVALMNNGFGMQWVEPGRVGLSRHSGHWVIVDDPSVERDAGPEAA